MTTIEQDFYGPVEGGVAGRDLTNIKVQNLTIVNMPRCPSPLAAARGYEMRERALGILAIALMFLTACVAVPQVELKLPLWLAGCALAGLGTWTNHRSEGTP